MLRGLVQDWKFPYFCDFDRPMIKSLFQEIICDIEGTGCKVLSSTCDQAGGNEGLKKDLGITITKVWCPNPYDKTRKLFFLFDHVHIFKNTRNHFLDHAVTLPNGMIIHAKTHFQELQRYLRANEISEGAYLKDILLDCKSSDRQTVAFARKLLSTKTANLLRKYFPNDAKKLALADIIEKFSNGQLLMKMC